MRNFSSYLFAGTAVVALALGCSRSAQQPPATPSSKSMPSTPSTSTADFGSPSDSNSNRGIGGGPQSGSYGSDTLGGSSGSNGSWDGSGSFGSGASSGAGTTGGSPAGIGGGPNDTDSHDQIGSDVNDKNGTSGNGVDQKKQKPKAKAPKSGTTPDMGNEYDNNKRDHGDDGK